MERQTPLGSSTVFPKGRDGFGSLARIFLSVIVFAICSVPAALAQCSNPPNAIVAENCLPGSPSSVWDVTGDGDPTLQGFATDISVNVGQTIQFKINTDATNYQLQIFRMGYYGGNGARQVATVLPSATLPQTQPACLTDASTNLYDCGNWAVSASWTVPANAVSGIYFVHMVRADTGGESHIVFIVRNDASTSKVLFQTADETWQAYNSYGGNSLYGQLDIFSLPNRAYKVSFNRPFITRGFGAEAATWVFGAEYPMVRWLESNGYDVSYFTGIDAARSGSLITNHSLYLSVGHDEYWSAPHRASVQAALAAGVNMAFFSGNEVFWKTRWENSIDGTNTPYRTLVCYKETLDGTSSGGTPDPQDPPTWTGTWRDPRFSPPADGGKPENALTGTLFMVNGPSDVDNPGNLQMQVPAADGKMRFWRNTAVASLAPNATYTMPLGSLGYEWDEDVDNGSRPAGAFHLSTATYTLTEDLLLDQGATYGAGQATHHMMMYRAPSGALVFGAGSVQWSWGLDSTHDNPFFSPNADADVNMQQATVNLFADMGVQPTTLQPGLVPATKSTDTTPPASLITTPTSGSTVNTGSLVTLSGTATDSGGGVVGGVEVSVDGGQTWHPATGRGSWTYQWVPNAVGTVTIQSRAVDDSGNLETPSSGYFLTVAPQICPCDAWSPSNPTAVPTNPDSGDPTAGEFGVKFTADVTGYVTGIRFYKSAANTGTHIGHVWSSTGTLLGTATFTNETSSGWQQVSFANAVPVAAGTIYVASYFAPVGHYAGDDGFFATSGLDDPPIHLVANTVSPNGVFTYGSTSAFPATSFNAANYWVDVVFVPSTINLTPSPLAFTNQVVGTSSSPQTITMSNTGNSSLSITGISITGTNSSDYAQTNTCGTSLAAGANCTITVTFTPTGTGVRSANVVINDSAPASPQLVGLTGTGTVPQQQPGVCPCSIWDMTVTPALVDAGDPAGVELGVKFTADQNGTITGIRFYKSTANAGTHIGNLWNASGGLLATVTFTNEGVSGWQQMNFSNPVAVTANTTYVASYYAPGGHYSADGSYFEVNGHDNAPLHALSTNVSPDGVYMYGTVSSFPALTFNGTNYWIDVVFQPSTVNLSPSSLTFATQTVGTSSASQAVSLSNTGTATVSLASIVIGGANPVDFTQTNNCGASLAAGASCTINVTFAPTASGARAATLTVTDSALGGPQVLSLSGTAIAPAATLSATSLTYASQDTGTESAAQTVILSNTGSATFNFTSITIAGVNNTDFTEVNNCGTSLALGSSCTISVTFAPTATGTRSATLTITDNVPGSPQLIGLTGTGVSTPPPPATCPCSIWSPASTPSVADSQDGNGVELGVNFTSSQSGFISGIRFYKSAANTGTHIGNLWTSTGVQLATVTFTNEGASGWQQMAFSSPVAITANTTYVASYYAPVGHYSVDSLAFTVAGVNTPPLQALANSVTPDGVFTYGPASSFPSSSAGAANYWVDVIFTPSTVSLSSASVQFGNQILATSSSPQTVTLFNTGTTTLNLSSIAITGANSGDFTQTNNCGASVAGGTNCTINVTFTPAAIGTRSATLTISDDALGSPQTATLTGVGMPIPGVCPCSIWAPTVAPTTQDSGDSNSVEVGVNFTSDQSGLITGIRFYKSAANTGTHIGNLWTLSGTLLATGTFTNETASGWQQLNFTSPVAITANTTYVASYYAPVGHYAADGAFFASSGVDNSPLHALSNAVDPNGVFSYGATSSFPLTSFNATNYWVDVVFTTSAISLSPAAVSFNNQPVGIASVSQLVTLANNSGVSLNLSGIAFTGANSGDFSQTNTCGASLATGASCSISVTFTPSQNGGESATLNVSDDGAGSPQTASLTGTGVTSGASLAPAPLAFASQSVGTISGPQAITLSNTGGAPLNITGIAITGANSGDFAQTNTCGTSVAAGANCSINVTFSPTAAGARNASVAVTDNATGSPHTASLTGTGVAPTANFLPGSLIFANQLVGTSSGAQGITLSNTGASTLTISSIAITGANSGDFAQTNTCGTSVAAGANCSINITFSPAAAGTRSASVTVTDNATGSPQSAGLTGTGLAPAANLTPGLLTFANQTVGTSSGAQALTLSNTGTSALTITSIAITGANSGDFAQTNTCGTSVAAGGGCSINVTFRPTATGTRSAAVAVTDNATGSPHTAALSGTGATPAVSLAPASLAFGNQLVNTTSTAQTITLTNTGTGALTLTSIAITGTNSGDFAQTNTCGTGVAAGANCSINVTFRPTVAAARSATVTITDNATGSPQTVGLTGTGGVPTATLSPSSLNFANQIVGSTSAAQAITVTNNGTAALNLTVSITGTNSGDYSQTNTCPASVAIGGHCTVSVTFKPTATGTRTAAVTFTDNAANSPQAVTLNGTAIAPNAIVSPASLTFASQSAGTTSPAQTITLSNTGNATLTLTSIAITGANSGDFAQTNTCGGSVAVGGHCSINVTFKPTANGARSAAVTITDNAQNSPQTASLTGTGLAPVVSLAPASLTYASQLVATTSAAQAITLSNTGSATLTLTSIAITGTNAGDFAQTNTCGASVAAGAHCAINVTFKPTASGTRSATVSITDNATGSPQTAALTGTGIAPIASLSPASIAFGTVAQGVTTSGTAVTLSNTGTATMNLTSITITGANTSDFSQTNTCGATLGAGSNCVITVKFSPKATGARSASVSVADNATGSPQTVALSGTGTGVTLSTTALAFANQNIFTTSAAQTITLQNVGTGTLTFTSITIAGTNRTDFSETNTCGTRINAGASCTISVKFTPLARGARTASVSIADSDPTTPQTVTLSGTGQ